MTTTSLLLALFVAGTLAVAARRARALSEGGALAAAIVGTCVVLAGWGWALLLLAFFVSSSALSRWRAAERDALTNGMLAKPGERDAAQVLANGGLFALAALGAAMLEGSHLAALGAGALAAATADTWSTEIGTVRGGTPRHLLSGEPMPPGASGGVTRVGSAAAIAGALLIAAVSALPGIRAPFVPVWLGGIAGALCDSLLGATVQERRWCPSCELRTERRVHRCGTATDVRGGVAGFGNDLVNVASVTAGGLVAWLLAA